MTKAPGAKTEQGSLSLAREAEHDSPAAPRAQSQGLFRPLKTTRATLRGGSLSLFLEVEINPGIALAARPVNRAPLLWLMKAILALFSLLALSSCATTG